MIKNDSNVFNLNKNKSKDISRKKKVLSVRLDEEEIKNFEMIKKNTGKNSAELLSFFLNKNYSSVNSVNTNVNADVNTVNADVNTVNADVNTVNADVNTVNADVNTVNSVYSKKWLDMLQVFTEPVLIVPSILLLLNTALLTYWQGAAYKAEGINLVESYVLASLTEVILLVSTAHIFVNRSKKMAGFIFCGIFLYVLGVMAFDINSNVTKDKTNIVKNSSLMEDKIRYGKALGIAEKGQDHKNIKKYNDKLDVINLKLSDKNNSKSVKIIESKGYGLITIRFILMLFSVLLVDFILDKYFLFRRQVNI